MENNQNINVGTFIAVGRPYITHHGRLLSQRTEHGKFKSFFGASAEVCFDVWYKLDPQINISRSAQPKHLLWAGGGFGKARMLGREDISEGGVAFSGRDFRNCVSHSH
jgi:hypothetical protein